MKLKCVKSFLADQPEEPEKEQSADGDQENNNPVDLGHLAGFGQSLVDFKDSRGNVKLLKRAGI